MMLSALVVAQNIKKVAVWETKCDDKSVTSFQSAMVRGGMETAVANAPGYTGYDRASFDAILKEHNFQRSGAVSDSDIKRMGVMAGVQYIIVPEAYAQGNDFYIIVKMLDVETGEFGAAYDELCGSSASEIKQACTKLGGKLFGNSGGDSGYKEVAAVYTDLGLPSGTIWKNFNATGFYTYDQAVSQFGTRLPSKAQWEELKAECQWTWTGSGYKVTGPNGNSITLPAEGVHNCYGHVTSVGTYGNYWSSTPKSSEFAWSLNFYSHRVSISSDGRCNGLSVRLVQD